ncbi:putative dTDP-4-dehydrorhamnose 3,5-epimerase [Actinoplanes missouriensis 431]|uniref:Putative dTDP-4-dehydrorhamnose 3,5-epimerase n=1 Tax=Actinoplanes missouriensis (strain ATCC 14538 / DSM 43046 / CBS 188.64 / JCM 3121 / NBRC 102363 / NCIMB 12654 / NRRL B-3342 / UNCC 431) TaxID=512565 RepID=I0HB94_ACTM4|nr:dTDP-4-dehydrorhamnose 3,5-epimerase [Actinoplanes missouriensis]BAL90281.1 putative dTDP-4-dehydrorhamnose 3,5-epimerase [Actinoplanes missouriensis 431]
MKARELAVAGAFAFTPEVFADDRGTFCSPLQEDSVAEVLGRPLFGVRQSSVSRSRRGVVRGVHFTALPVSMAKYVFCTRGMALDYVIDLRRGSPTFGRTDVIPLDPENGTAVYLPSGVGHLFVSLRDDTTMTYLLSAAYTADKERAVHPLDPELGLELPPGLVPVLSERDRTAPTLAQARERDLLPAYRDCLLADAA